MHLTSCAYHINYTRQFYLSHHFCAYLHFIFHFTISAVNSDYLCITTALASDQCHEWNAAYRSLVKAVPKYVWRRILLHPHITLTTHETGGVRVLAAVQTFGISHQYRLNVAPHCTAHSSVDSPSSTPRDTGI